MVGLGLILYVALGEAACLLWLLREWLWVACHWLYVRLPFISNAFYWKWANRLCSVFPEPVMRLGCTWWHRFHDPER